MDKQGAHYLLIVAQLHEHVEVGSMTLSELRTLYSASMEVTTDQAELSHLRALVGELDVAIGEADRLAAKLRTVVAGLTRI